MSEYFSFQARLILLVVLVGLMSAGIVITALVQMNTNQKALTEAVETLGERTDSLWSIQTNTLKLSAMARDIILLDTERSFRNALKKIRTALGNLEEQIAEAEIIMPEEDRETFELFQTSIGEWKKEFLEVQELARKDVDVGDSYSKVDFDRVAVRQLKKKSDPKLRRSLKILNEIIEDAISDMKELKNDSSKRLVNSNRLFGILGILAIVASIMLTALSIKSIELKVRRLLKYFKDLQRDADLSVEVPELGSYEFGTLAKAIDGMRGSLLEQEEELDSANKKLLRLVRRLAHKNDEIERFVYTVSHDLKSPLVTCTGFLGMLREDLGEGANDAVLGSLERVERACAKMNRIIDELLELSRIGRETEEFKDVDINEIVSRLVEDLRSTEAERVIIEVESPLPNVYGRATSVERAFENLLSNAIRYGTSNERPRIRIGHEIADGEVRYFVEDNGEGVPEEYRVKIFGLFQQLSTSDDSTGVGLASVHRIMQVHEGTAWVDEGSEGGARFWLCFPKEQEWLSDAYSP